MNEASSLLPLSPAIPEIDQALALLRAGELVAFPTETVYGLGANASNPAAVAKIFAAKGRPADHPVIVHLPGAAHLEHWARDIPTAAWELAEAFWPGPLTLILKRASGVPDVVTGGQDTVGLRVPAHPLARELLRAFAEAGGTGAHGGNKRCGIAAPSANRFGRISPTTAAHVRAELGDAVRLVLDGGPCQLGIESTILDLSRDAAPPRLLRPGSIAAAQIELVLGVSLESIDSEKAKNSNDGPRVSGSLEAHYAPQTPMRSVATDRLLDTLNALHQEGRRCAVLSYSLKPPSQTAMPYVWRKLPDNPAAYAHDLYAALRELDQAGTDLIVLETIPEEAAWLAVADRLRRATYGAGCGTGKGESL